MNDTSHRGHTALVTGSIQGIGLAIAKAFAANGARVAVHGLATPEEAEKAVAEVLAAGATDARFFGGDMRDPDAIDAMMDAVMAWGDIDILVNNAGIQKPMSLADLDRGTWDDIIAVNLSAAFHTMRRVLPGMAERGYGRVINISSAHGKVASIDKAPYVAAKHGIIGLTKVAALEYATAGSRSTGGVTANCICPGFTETPLIKPQVEARATMVGGDRDAGIADLLSEKQPSLRTSYPDEIGAAALWLASPIAHNVTGIDLSIDGGWTVQ